MKRKQARAFWAAVGGIIGLAACRAAEIEFVTVGDAGNAPYVDWQKGPVGSVDHVYRIGKYEITQEQYLDFLNAVDPQGSNSYNICNTNVPTGWYGSPETNGCDFVLDLAQPEGRRYALKLNRPTTPVWGVNWYSAARFCNWLHNNKGGPGSTEGDATNGVYDTRNFDDGIATNDPPTHNPGARFWLPTMDEWFKAAYYKGGSTNAGYWNNPNRNDDEPIGGNPPGGTNSENCTPRMVGGSYPPYPLQRTAVGAYSNSISPYGAFDMAGNGNEWTERVETDTWGQVVRRTMGGAWYWKPDHASAYAAVNYSTHQHPPTDLWDGFRIAALEDPDSDHDGMPDGWERAYGLDPQDAGDATRDRDGDGMSNLAEYRAGTDPMNSQSVLRIGTGTAEGDTYVIGWASVAGRHYRVARTTNLTGGAWQPLAGLVTACPPMNTYTDHVDSIPAAFYRVNLE